MQIDNKLWESAAVTHIGKVRKTNQDDYINLPEKYLWVVADGMGGHESGELASAAIVQALMQIPETKSIGAKSRAVNSQLRQVNQELLALAGEQGKDAIIGSTVAILLAHGEHCVCLWSGDSRIYILRDGKLRQLSRDHTYAAKLVDAGYSFDQANNSLFSNSLTHAVGIEADLYLEAETQKIMPGDVFLLCSDGLTKHVTDIEIAVILNLHNCEQAAAMLLEATLAAGAYDNTTIVVVRPMVD